MKSRFWQIYGLYWRKECFTCSIVFWTEASAYLSLDMLIRWPFTSLPCGNAWAASSTNESARFDILTLASMPSDSETKTPYLLAAFTYPFTCITLRDDSKVTQQLCLGFCKLWEWQCNMWSQHERLHIIVRILWGGGDFYNLDSTPALPYHHRWIEYFQHLADANW